MIFLEVLPNISDEIIQISRWVKGLGIIAIIWLAYSAIIFYINRKNAQTLKKIKKDLSEVNNKLDKLIKRK
ncbi:MAG: hypothetical protein IIA85_02495 [Nanoarchaeota archaeon]|nr:hypothetical protein [Nanoarchaeota archaeon]